MGRYDGIYLFCDLDGTLLDDGKAVPEANLEALKEFLSEGGRFGMATGRSPHNLNMGLDLGLINAPCILCNGAVLYGLERREYLHCDYLPGPESVELTKRIIRLRPSATVQICTQKGLYQVNPNPDRWEDPLVPLEHIPIVQCGAEEIAGDWIKVVVPAPARELDGLVDELGREEIEKKYSVTRSGEIYIEFLPLGATKGGALGKLRGLLPEGARLLAIGDYYNDLEMLRAADVSAAPANAPEDIKEIVDYSVCRNDHGAVADFLKRAL